MTKSAIHPSKLGHILLWFIAALYLLFSPSLYYRFFPHAGKPLEVWTVLPKETSEIRFNVEDCKYWSENMVSYEERETYALWGWTFLNRGPDTRQADFDRFVVLYDGTLAYVFPMQVYPRPEVQDRFKTLGFSDLTSAGFTSVISMNALAAGEYRIGILFKHKQDSTTHYIQTNKILVRSPNHLSLERKSK